MLSNYIKVAFRNLLRRKGYSAIVISGLAIGMACCIVILLYVQHELSYDQFNENHDRIYQLIAERKTAKGTGMDLTMPPPLAPTMLKDIPQITQAVRFLSMDNPIPLIGNGDRKFYEQRVSFVDSSIADVFTLTSVRGDVGHALQKPNTVVITEEISRKYFNDENPLGKILTLNGAVNLEVAGVVKGFPSNSSVQADFLVSFPTLANWLGSDFVNNWQNNTCQIYILLGANSSPDVVTDKLSSAIGTYFGQNSTLQKIHLEPLDRFHLFAFRDYGIASSGDIQNIFLLSGIAFLVLLVACVNFANLTTARVILRSKEVGIRKMVGASRMQLVQQFLCDAGLSMMVALILSIVLVEIGLPYVQSIAGKDLAQGYAASGKAWLGPILAVFAIGFLSSIYPASVLSSMKPLENAKGSATTGVARVLLKKGMVVFQFALTIILIIGTWVIFGQLQYMQNKQLGFDKDRIMVVPIRDQRLRQDTEALKHRLLQSRGIVQVGAAALLPGGPVGRTRYRSEGFSSEGTMSMLWVDRDFGKALDLKFAAGRDFSNEFATDASEGFILNEQAARQLGWNAASDAIGKPFELLGGKKGHIIGVVKDFNFVSLHRTIEPLVIHIWPWMNYLLVRVDASRPTDVLATVRDIYGEFDQVNPFTFTFLTDNFERFYASDRQLGTTFGSFTLLTLLIACSGLLSLAAFSTEQRTKEIGVRKVLGASVPGIVGMLTREYLVLVLLANLVAWPVSYFVMNRWLMDFAFRINIGVETFLFAGGVSVIIAMLTVSYQALKAALSNPIEALRYE